MPKLIIACGLPGVGKTTFAKELSKRLKIACIHKDSIKERFFESMNMSSLEESKMIGKPVIDVLFRLTEEQLKNGVDLIIEAPFNFPEDYPLFEKWQKEYSLALYAVICSINADERKRRFQKRERHHAHHDIDRKHIRSMGQQNYEYDYAEIPGKQIRITTDKPVSELVEEVVSQL